MDVIQSSRLNTSLLSPSDFREWVNCGEQIEELDNGITIAVIHEEFGIFPRPEGGEWHYRRCSLCGRFDECNFLSRDGAPFKVSIDGSHNSVCERCGEIITNVYKKKRTGRYLTWPDAEYEAFRASQQPKRRPISGRARKEILERDFYRCRYCGDHRHLSLDHIIPWSKGGSDDADNLVTACRRCNSKKGDKTIEERKMALKEAGYYK